MNTREQWAKMVSFSVAIHPLRDKVVDWLMDNQDRTDVPICVWHAFHVVSGSRHPCSCTPCTLARGEKLSCM